jgi:predicted HicB family RNase H-like nuclease
MTRTLVIRGFNDKVHEKLGNLATQKGISINSIVRDAVDKWLEQQQSEESGNTIL